MYITNQPAIAKIAEKNTVDRIWVDLEIRNKSERQQGMDTVISHHQMSDVNRIKEVLDTASLLVRINPMYEKTAEEIDEVISRGADIIMLPMYETADEAKRFIDMVGGRAKTILLLETIGAEKCLDKVLCEALPDEIYIGMNDLHIQYRLNFMFELLSNGKVEEICKKISSAGVSFGFGGIAQLDQGTLPARYILGEHYRLGSNSVILSRSFVHHLLMDNPEIAEQEFGKGMRMMREYEKWLEQQSGEFFEENRKRVVQTIEDLRSMAFLGGDMQ